MPAVFIQFYCSPNHLDLHPETTEYPPKSCSPAVASFLPLTSAVTQSWKLLLRKARADPYHLAHCPA